ncbi:leucine-rich repeat domain-containing protein [Larkinella insperata]|uniref:Leucine-rich repeat domain-containing protein n=1 Tax=Larkinella insperata TaxID=332158 RepID=A0ABW3Q3K9_9BACT|nr:leucine-rich repeat domain-containing protein [Larkinella insperata]
MSTFFRTLLAVFISGSTLAQTVCLTQAEHKVTVKKLEKEYIAVDKVIDPTFGTAPIATGPRLPDEWTPGEKKRFELYTQVEKDVNQFFKKAGLLQDTTCYLIVHLYANPDGSLNKVYHEFSTNLSPKAPDSLALKRFKERMDPVLCQWFSSYRFPVTGDKPYRYSSGMAVGKLPSRRKLRRGPGILTTLEQAEKTTRPDTVKHLVFNTLELTEVPEVIYRFPNLEVLDLSINGIRTIPERVFTMPKLRQLDASYNPLGSDGLHVVRNKHLKILNIQSTGLTAVPKAITKNRRLESLWLGFNNFSGGLNTAPLRRIRRLKDLNLYHARLNELPASISRLKRLEVLDLYYNNLRTLPESACRMRRLQQLALSNNKLNELPRQLGRLRKLQELYAHHNFLASLPASSEKLNYLRTLDIGHNAFVTVPQQVLTLPNLEEFDISHNRLTELPVQMSQLHTLKKLFIRGNPVSEQKTVSANLLKQLEGNKTEVFY